MRRLPQCWLKLGSIACLALVLFESLAAAEPPPIRVGVLTDNFPYSFREGDGEVKGFAYDLVGEIEQVMGLKFERVMGVTSEIHSAFAAGQLELLQSYGQFPERENQADFSVPYLILSGVIFVRDGETRIQSVADLRERRVLVHRGSMGETVLLRAGLGGSIVYAESVEQSLVKLDRGEGDAVLVSRLSGLAVAHRLGLKRIHALPQGVEGYDLRYCIATRKGQPVLLAKLNEGLAILVRTGRFEALYQKWFGHVDRKGYTAEQVTGAVAIGLALALTVAVWAGVKQRSLRNRIAQQAEALRVSEERHRGIFEGAHEGLLVLGGDPADFLVEQINPSARRMLAMSVGFAEPTRLAEALANDAPLLARVRSVAAEGRIEEFEHERPDGEWLRVDVGPLGRRRLVALTNITEQVQARRRLYQQEEQIRQKQKLEAVGTLAGGVAHDFNNLLTSIMGNTELVLMNLPDGHAEREGMQQVLIAARRARDLVRQILSFSRKSAPGREVVIVRQLVKETIDLLQTLARSAVEFEVNIPADLPPILADPAQVHQALMNIGTNAVQAMRGSAGRLSFRAETIEVGTERPEHFPPGLRPGNYVKISVQDSGPGMAPEVQVRAFEPFYTTKAPGEGTGLGLSVVHGIMQQHAGAVTLYSQVGRGSLFNLYFPAATEQLRGSEKSKPEAIPTGRGEHVLVVDDEISILKIVQKMLGQLGYRVSVFGRAEEAWAAFAKEPDAFAVVLSDLTMPGMNGLQLLDRVRALRAGQPFVLTSGLFSEAERSEASGLGVTGFLPKPLSYGEVGRAIVSAMAKK